MNCFIEDKYLNRISNGIPKYIKHFDINAAYYNYSNRADIWPWYTYLILNQDISCNDHV